MNKNVLIVFLFFTSYLCVSSAFSAEAAHFHHVRLNVQDRAATQEFYQKVFGAIPINFNDKTPGLFTERSFILMNKVDAPPMSNLKTSIWHIGWGGIDGPKEFEWWKNQGVEFYTPLTELGSNHYMYMYGVNREIIEIYTGGKHHRFNHVHILATDTDKTTAWLMKALELPESANRSIRVGNIVTIDNVQIIVYPNSEDRYRPKEQGEVLEKTEESAIAHIAFSFRDIDAAYKRMNDLKMEIADPIKVSELHGLRSFFARATDGILVEFVEAKPIPEGIWE